MTPSTHIDVVQNTHEPRTSPDAIADPVFLLSPPLSLSSYACAMLGQHPQMYSLPETHLFLAETISDWWEICAKSSFNMAHGLWRAIAELYFGGQTEHMATLFTNHLAEIETWVGQRPEIEVLYVSYNDLVQNPSAVVERIKTFLNRPLNVDAMIATVDRLPLPYQPREIFCFS